MRCVDVIRELAAPTGRQSSEIGAHLEQCPRCATWAERDARLGRLWEATRPPELSLDAWERIWARASNELDAAEAPVQPTAVIGRLGAWKRVAMPLFAVAQAAAILVGFALLAERGPGQPAAAPRVQGAVAENETVVPKFDVDSDQMVLIDMDRQSAVDVTSRMASNENSNAVDPFYRMLNELEAQATLQ